MKLTKLCGVLLLSLLLTTSGMSQTVTFGGQASGGQNFGMGDVINILGGTRGNGSVLGNQNGGGNDKLRTAIGIASILYQVSRQNSTSSVPGRSPQPTYYPDAPRNPQPTYYPNPQPYPSEPQYPTNYPDTGGLVRPEGYDAIAFGNRTLRLDPSILPLSINPGDARYTQLVEHAVDTWNNAGLGQLFVLTGGEADLTIDWTGSKVTSGARAETRMARSSSRVVPTDLSVRTNNRSSEQLARVMTHELGHVLGLDHSTNRDDVMYRSEQNRPLGLTQRDRQMLHWLYSQNNYLPVVGRTDIGQGTAVASRFSPQGFAQPSFGTPASVCTFHEH